MKAQTHAVRQDVMRGARWGAILVIALLLSVTVYRMFILTPAVATPKAAAPAPAVAAEPAAAVAEPRAGVEVKTEESVSEPAKKPAIAIRRSPNEEVPPPPAPRARDQRALPAQTTANRFAPTPVATPGIRTTVVEGTLPEVGAAPVTELPATPGGAELAPPPDKEPGRTGKIVRGVGRIFRIGRKEPQEKGK